MIGKSVRATIVPRAVLLSSGVVDTATFQSSTGTIPVLGHLPGNALIAPAQQFSSGLGGELQLVGSKIGVAVGYTPYTFLVSNVTGRFRWRPAAGHFTLFADRDTVKDTQLSYAGIRDPASITGLYSGDIWGGVVSTTGGARLDIGNEKSGLYLSADGGTLSGYQVLDNRKFEGSMGAYFLVARWPDLGSLNVGAGIFGMHYDHNERGMTFGQGGYFSPNIYFLASVPVSWTGHYGNDFHYTVNGSAGLQTFQEASAPYYPLDRASQLGSGNAYYSQRSNTGLNYGIDSEASYRATDHWFVGGFFTGNNTNNYNTVTGGFFVRYLFKPQIGADLNPTGLFPINDNRPLKVP